MDSYGFGACGLKGSGLWSAGGRVRRRVESGCGIEFEDASATAPFVSRSSEALQCSGIN